MPISFIEAAAYLPQTARPWLARVPSRRRWYSPSALAPLTDAAVRVEVDRLVGQVTAARRLPFRGTLQARPVTRDAADALVAAALAARVTTSNFGVEERIMKRLGLIAGAADYTKLWAAGARRPPRSRPTIPRRSGCWCPDFLPLDGQRVALLHEIAHAVADQRFDLRRFLAPPASETAAAAGRRRDARAARAGRGRRDAGRAGRSSTRTATSCVPPRWWRWPIACAPPPARGGRPGSRR